MNFIRIFSVMKNITTMDYGAPIMLEDFDNFQKSILQKLLDFTKFTTYF